jgi:aspartyl-tRNA(Asn)/glutamyl-tRNA(Gln) amidotransferase subunit C
MISKEEVQHIAKLARLGLSDKEIEKNREELAKILDYIEKLKEVDVSRVEPTSHSIKIENVMRKDESSSSKFPSSKLIDTVPDKKDSFVKVKSILSR